MELVSGERRSILRIGNVCSPHSILPPLFSDLLENKGHSLSQLVADLVSRETYCYYYFVDGCRDVIADIGIPTLDKKYTMASN